VHHGTSTLFNLTKMRKQWETEMEQHGRSLRRRGRKAAVLNVDVDVEVEVDPMDKLVYLVYPTHENAQVCLMGILL
jgi:hypothetical protein